MTLTRNRRRRAFTASPGFIPPQLATLVTQAPDGPQHLHEIKLDGYRIAARLDSGDVLTDSYTGASFNNKNVGTAKPVSVSGISISGTDAGNYALASTTTSTGALTNSEEELTQAGM